MKIEYKKGDNITGWRVSAEVRQIINELELEEVISYNEQLLGGIPVLKQVATKDFTIEITTSYK